MKPVPMMLFKGIGDSAHRIALGVVLAAMFVVPHAVAQDAAPDTLLKAVTTDVIAIIRQDQNIQTDNPAKVADLVETRILPLFNFTRMTQIAVARNWRSATPAQRETLSTEFKLLLVRTYATVLSSYRDQVIEFKPLRVTSGDTVVTVKSVIKQSGAAPITMDFDMEKTAAVWKVYDIKIDGISLISAYRETFAGKVRDSGLEGLIQSIADKNQQGEVRFRPRPTEDFYFPMFIWGILQGGR